MNYHLKINKQSSLAKIHWNQISTKYTPRFIIIAFNNIFAISYINEEADLQRECNNETLSMQT